MADYELNIRDYFYILRKRKHIVLGVTIGVVFHAVALYSYLRTEPGVPSEQRLQLYALICMSSVLSVAMFIIDRKPRISADTFASGLFRLTTLHAFYLQRNLLFGVV